MARGPRQLFIYWRTPVGQVEVALAVARQVQQQLRVDAPGLHAGLYLRRNGDNGAQATLMETYALPGTGIDVALQARIEAAAAALGPFLAGARHVEVFDVVD